MEAEKFEDFESANKPDEKGAEAEKPAEEAKAAEKPAEEAKADEKSEATDTAARDWQSKADTEAARANKAEAELARFKAERTNEKPAEAPAPNGEDPWVQASKGNFRDDLFKSDPRLGVLGFSPELIQGTTPSEMKKSFESLQGTVNRMESGIRNQVLIENGLEPVPGSGERATGVNYSTMPKEEFDKLVDAAMRS